MMSILQTERVLVIMLTVRQTGQFGIPGMLRQKGFTYFRLMADIYQLGKPAFREYSIFFYDELEIKNKEGNDPIDPHTGLLSSTTAISYRSEPMRNRMPVSHDPADSGEESVEAGT